MKSCLNGRTSISPEPVFLGISSLDFPKISLSDRNVGTKKGQKWIFQENSCLLKNGQKGPNMGLK